MAKKLETSLNSLYHYSPDEWANNLRLSTRERRDWRALSIKSSLSVTNLHLLSIVYMFGTILDIVEVGEGEIVKTV